jgi:hypothetical protein
MTLFPWDWIQFIPKKLLNSTVETKRGSLLKSRKAFALGNTTEYNKIITTLGNTTEYNKIK